MKKIISFFAIICYIWVVLWLFNVPFSLGIQALFIFILAPGTVLMHYFYKCHLELNGALHVNSKSPVWKELLLYIPIFFVGSFLKGFIATEVPQNQGELVKTAIEMNTAEIFFILVIFCPALEEMFLRYIPNIFIKNDWVYILLTSTIFAAGHVVNDPHAFRNFWAYFITPVYWTYRYRKTNNIFVPLSMHMFGNFIATLALLHDIRS